MIGEKIRSLFRPSEAMPLNGAGVYIHDFKPALRPARATPPPVETDRRSNGLRQFFENLPRESRLKILDLGGASQANINFIALQGHKLYTEDLMVDIQRVTAPGNGLAGNVAGFIEENLTFPQEQFDGVLVWDTLEFLEEDMMWAAVSQMQSILKPGGTLLTFFHTHAKGETVHVYRYQIRDRQSLHLQPRFSRPLPRAFNNRSLERLFGNFHSVKFFLANDNLREVIVTR
ncbi:MAG TPA: class I SAM-dependent methyltransferase [Bryobacterales bacterium]|nr:class I SAM-dependent methyltransferase [Bryobacterales bacterium]